MGLKYKFISLIFIALIFCFPSLLGYIIQTVAWIFSLEFKGAPVSLIGDIFLKYTCPVITGTLMTFVHIKNKEVNTFVLLIVGIIVGFIFSYVVMISEKYGYIILMVCILIFIVLLSLLKYKKANKTNKL